MQHPILSSDIAQELTETHTVLHYGSKMLHPIPVQANNVIHYNLIIMNAQIHAVCIVTYKIIIATLLNF